MTSLEWKERKLVWEIEGYRQDQVRFACMQISGEIGDKAFSLALLSSPLLVAVVIRSLVPVVTANPVVDASSQRSPIEPC